MKNMILSVTLLCLFFCCGCIDFYSYKQYQVKVIDPENDISVNGANIDIDYVYFLILNHPEITEFMTDTHGTAEVKVADFGGGSTWKIKADGYIPIRARGVFDDRRIPEIFYVGTDREIVIPLYKEPEPKIEIIVPDAYRGPIALHLTPKNEWIQEEPGKRIFSYKILPNGYVPVQASPLLWDVHFSNIGAKYENGDSISSSAYRKPDLVAFRWITTRWHKRLYVVGTKEEQYEIERKIWPESKDGRVIGSSDDTVFNSYFQE